MTTTKTKPATITDTTTIAADACRQLNLTGLAPALDELCDQATRRRLSHSTFLAEALQIELDIRHERRRARRNHEARLPRVKTLDDFDLDANTSIDATTIAMLRDGTFIDNNEPVVLLGNSGTGKSHLPIGACLAAAENGRRARDITCAQLANELAEANDDHKISRVVTHYGRYDLLAIDELGYVRLDQHSAQRSCSSRSSPNEKNAPRSPSRRTLRSANGQDIHRPAPRRSRRRSHHLPRPHHPNRHRQLPAQQPITSPARWGQISPGGF